MPIVNQRHNAARKTGLIRPSSGYYSHTVKRNDSDTESGRLSPSSVSYPTTSSSLICYSLFSCRVYRQEVLKVPCTRSALRVTGRLTQTAKIRHPLPLFQHQYHEPRPYSQLPRDPDFKHRRIIEEVAYLDP